MEIFVNREITRFVLIFSHPVEELRTRYRSKKVERLFVQSSECDQRIGSFASPPYFITLLNFSVNEFCTEVHNEVLRMTNDFLYPSNRK